MENVTMEVKGDNLIITVNLKKNIGLSGSGKSLVIGSTQKNQSVPGYDDIKVGVNVYRRK
jgi:hypothetical protein